ncbi:MAG: DUF4148 domain-containing protein [Luteimonas sp.]|nr:DUF4148 domain-containing protein [Luteimonas sp.]
MNRPEHPSFRMLFIGHLLLGVATNVAAQDVPASRAQVKAETKSAAAQGQLTPAGEGAYPKALPASSSSRTRAERKTETRQAARTGELIPAGETGSSKVDRAVLSSKSTKTRQERKAETLAAAKAKQLTPAGEGTEAPLRK